MVFVDKDAVAETLNAKLENENLKIVVLKGGTEMKQRVSVDVDLREALVQADYELVKPLRYGTIVSIIK